MSTKPQPHVSPGTRCAQCTHPKSEHHLRSTDETEKRHACARVATVRVTDRQGETRRAFARCGCEEFVLPAVVA